MSRISETLGYARGMLKAMETAENADKNLLELLGAMCTAMEEQAHNIRKLDEQFSELDEYVESIDDDLADLENSIDGIHKDEDDFFFDDDEDEDEEDFDDERPLHLVKRKHTCKCGRHHDEDHECHCHEEGHECHCHEEGHECHCHEEGHECHCHEEGHECHCHDDEEDYEDDCDCEDEDDMDLSGFDNLFLGVLCPECGHMFCVTDDDFDAPGVMYNCPFCRKDVHVSPIDPNNVPVAKRVK